MIDQEYVYVRKRGKMYYPFNVGYVCSKITLQEALEKGYKPSSNWKKLQDNVQ